MSLVTSSMELAPNSVDTQHIHGFESWFHFRLTYILWPIKVFEMKLFFFCQNWASTTIRRTLCFGQLEAWMSQLVGKDYEKINLYKALIQFLIKVKCSPNRLGTFSQEHIKVHLGLHVHCHGGIIWNWLHYNALQYSKMSNPPRCKHWDLYSNI